MQGAELRQLREAWGMTQQQFARLLGYSAHTISDIERGKKTVTKMLEKHVLAVKLLREIQKLAEPP
jgi:DNA-binding transcriptional regulator YiaG